MFFSLRYAFLISILALSCLETERLAAAELPQDEGTSFLPYLLFSLVLGGVVLKSFFVI
jgi:hypothetical protein